MDKDLIYFIENYPDEEERYWVISDYLWSLLDNDVNIDFKTRNELLNYMYGVTFKLTGRHPINGVISMTKLNLN